MSTTGDDASTPDQPSGPAQPNPPGAYVPPPAPSPYGPPATPAPLAGEAVSFAGMSPATTDVLAPGAPRRRSRRTPIIAALVVGVLAVGGAAAWAVSSFLSGGGAQPESVVPANAIAYADVDLDPSAGQKIAAFRFIRKFPSSDQTSGQGDLVGQVVKTLLKNDDTTKINYDADIKPWLGKRAGIAAVPTPGDETPKALVAIQVTNEGKARTSLRKLLDEDPANAFADDSDDSGSASGDSESGLTITSGSGSSSPAKPEGLVVRDGYALIGEDQASVDAMSSAAQKAALGSSATYIADMKRIGDPGVASAWVDIDGIAELGSSAALFSTAGPSVLNGGRLVAGLRFDGGSVQLTAKQFGGTTPAGTFDHPGGPMLQTLPATTTGAFAVGDVSTIVDTAFASLQKQMPTQLAEVKKSAKDDLGLTLPADLDRLLGTGLAVSVGDVTTGDPQVAVKVRTADPAGSQDVLDTVLGVLREQADGFFDIPAIAHVNSTDGIVYSLTPEYASTVAATGTLGSDPVFREALPDAATASSAGFVDFAKVSAQVPDAKAKKNLAPLKSLGMTIRTQGNESTTVMRLVTR